MGMLGIPLHWHGFPGPACCLEAEEYRLLMKGALQQGRSLHAISAVQQQNHLPAGLPPESNQ